MDLERLFRDESGRILASLIRLVGDFDRAEEAMQEAFAIAAERWPASGVPPNPGGWLVTTARNRAIDRIRREHTLADKIHLLPPAAALRAVDGLHLDGYLYFHSTRGELLRRLGRDAEARAAYRRALELATSTPERRFLTRRLEEL